MKRFLTFATVVVLSLVGSSLLLAQSDPRIGTWKLNPAKSTQSDSVVPRKSETRTYESSGDSITMHSEVVMGDSSKRVYGVTAKADGKDYPYTGQQPAGADSVSSKRVGNVFTSEDKKGGKVLNTTTTTFSEDSKVMTLTIKGVNTSGQPVNSVRIYDKQ